MTNKAKLGGVLLVLLLGAWSLGCNKTAPEKEAKSSGVSGAYTVVSIDGHPIPESVSSIYTLNSDGTYSGGLSVIDSNGDSYTEGDSGSYIKDGANITFTDRERGAQFNATLEGSTLTFDIKGRIQVYKKTPDVERPEPDKPETQKQKAWGPVRA